MEESYGRLQWKGTDACVDISCSCGEYSHFDGYFFDSWECPHCKTKYSVSNVIKLLPI